MGLKGASVVQIDSWILNFSSQRLPVAVLILFFGKGKMTGVNCMLQQTALSWMLALINEFGEIGLNHDLNTNNNDDVVFEISKKLATH